MVHPHRVGRESAAAHAALHNSQMSNTRKCLVLHAALEMLCPREVLRVKLRQNYGTHHINTISAGGEFRYAAIVEASYISAHGSAEMDAEADADFLFFFSADAEATVITIAGAVVVLDDA